MAGPNAGSHFVRVGEAGLVVPRRRLISVTEIKDRELIEAAKRARREEAFNSKEDILTGVALRTTHMTPQGDVFTGGNMHSMLTKRHLHADNLAIIRADQAGAFRLDGAGIVRIAISAEYPHGVSDVPKYPCDQCSEDLFVLAAKSGVDTEVIVLNTTGDRAVRFNITSMFKHRNIPLQVALQRTQEQ